VRYHQSVVTRKYPLDPLKRVRAENVDRKARALSQAVAKSEHARGDLEDRERAKRAFEKERGDTERAERERLEKGELTAADLARGAAWGIGADLKKQVHERATDEARTAYARARAEADDERAGVSMARAEAKVVEKHHEAWQGARRADAIADDEESTEEAHLVASKSRGGA
jgi:hypothetical protein